jgi:hypothetical protein
VVNRVATCRYFLRYFILNFWNNFLYFEFKT